MLFFSNKAIGLDIDDRSIEVVELKKIGRRAKIVNFSRQALPRGVVVNGLVANPEQLSAYLNQAFMQAKPNSINPQAIAFTLPQTQCYNLVATLPTEEELINQAAIKQLVIKNFPLDIKDLVYSYQVIQAGAKETLIWLAAANRLAVKSWFDFFNNEKLSLEFMDNEIFALSRDLVYLDPKQPVCLVDIGSVRTNIAVMQAGAIYYDSSLALGGHWFTRSIAEAFKLKLVTAERKKLQLGLNRQIFPVLTKQLKTIAGEVKAAVNYYQEHYGGAIKEVVLLGGSSRLRGLVDFLQENVGLPVSLGRTKSLNEKLPLEYFGAIGLAWRALNKKKFRTEPDFIPLLKDGQGIKGEPLSQPRPIIKQTPEAKTAQPATKNMKIQAEENDDLNSEEPADSEEDLESGVSDELEKKLANQKKLLLLVLLIGLALLPAAFWYRQQERAKQAALLNRYTNANYSQVQSLEFTIPVKIGTAETGITEIKGRIVESTMAAGQNYKQALPEALNQAKVKLVKGEVLWPEPLNEVVNQETLAAPLILRWLAYSQTGAVKAGLARIDELNQQKTDYSFTNLETLAVEKTDDVNLLNLKIKITISAKQQIATPAGTGAMNNEPIGTNRVEATSTTATSSVATNIVSEIKNTAVKQVIIKTTETGWLNIREGPGASFAVVERINDSGTYEFLDEKGDWIKIKLPDGKSGWAAARYIQKL